MENKNITIDINDLLIKQAGLTQFFRTNNNIQTIDWNKSKGAIICELWECANELKNEGFKEWTKKGRTTETLEELTDILFFYLQTGNDLGVNHLHHWITTEPSIMEQILKINFTLLNINVDHVWTVSFAQYRGLVEILGFTWDDILETYDLKYQENIARQKRGY
jgi:dimeric dUTPase (all-alpha-NTP-PPase superfamily)